MNETLDSFHKRADYYRERYSLPMEQLPFYIRKIIYDVEDETLVSIGEMRKPGRATVDGLRARQIACHRLRNETKLSLMAIAAIFFRRNHVTVQRLLKKKFVGEL